MNPPQLENGYTRIAQELIEVIYQRNFHSSELRIILWVARNSYGWHRKKTEPTNKSIISKEVKIPLSTARWAIKNLILNNILTISNIYELSINKNYRVWQPIATGNPLPLATHCSKTGNPLPKNWQPIATHIRCKDKKDRKIAHSALTIPTFEQVKAYCLERRNLVDPASWIDHYTANGWMVGRNKMKNWQAAVRTWERMNVNGKKVSDVV